MATPPLLPRQIVPLPIRLPSTPLLSNFYLPTFSPGVSIHVYSIAFNPEIDNENRSFRRSLLKSVDDQLTRYLSGHILSGINLYAMRATPDIPILSCRDSTGAVYGLALKHVREVSLANVQGQKDTHMVLNITLKQVMRELGLVQVTKLPKFYDRALTQAVPEFGVNVWRGYTTELTMRKGVPMITIDFSSKIVHTRSLMDELQSFRTRVGKDWVNKAKQEFESRIVMTKYGNNRCYRIDEICLDKNPTHTFVRNKAPVSYIDYFRSQYQQEISDPRQPLIRSRIKVSQGEVEIYLIPELVCLTGLNDEERSDYNMMNILARFTRLEPAARLEHIEHLPNSMNTEGGARRILEQSALVIPRTGETVPSYDLSGEKVKLAGELINIGPDGNFQVRNGIAEPVALTNWAVMVTDRDVTRAKGLITDLTASLTRLSRNTAPPATVTYDDRSMESAINSLVRQKPTQIVVVLIPRGREGQKKYYQKVKRLTTTSAPLVTQVVVFPVNEKRYVAIVEKVALQIQAKIGAQLWITRPSKVFGENLMVIGVDVFHDTVEKKKSVLGFCATVHPDLSKYYSTVDMHTTGQEIAPTVGKLFLEAIHAYKQKAQTFPETVIFFRDGVSDSQTQAVWMMEVQAVLQACEQVRNGEAAYTPNVIYTIVIKKTAAKFFGEGFNPRGGRGRGGRSRGGITNPAPGTFIVDRVVPCAGDFYLVSHYANQGMSAPTLYRTIYASRPDGFPLEDLARLAYRLCHMYYNWSGAIKVPAPCMMAHKIAFLVGQCVHQRTNEAISSSSFYL